MKQRMGMVAYYAKAWQLWFSHRMETFVVEHGHTPSGGARCAGVTEMLAVRIRNFGGVLRELAPGASLDRNDFRVLLCQTSSRLAYLLYVTGSLLRINWKVPGVELVHGERIRCDYGARAGDDTNAARVYVEADGELVGTLPAEITIVPDALTLIAPRRK
jgi:diacylglycerol kinase (ATP)